ncbi:uncharacterized protein A4U43_C08F26690 [Asparagus officinalis]|uniref:probable nucleoredoxin 1 n=1 Tax=Asparagus officinalis TaxID=4686 RepID=UPI00098E2BE0|nr:probable nucleoredoxin 1 [Asparagus officinalis]ONK61144.1 uncharacterized protein A4U43_C08F26690 [Asparagus officinalis]
MTEVAVTEGNGVVERHDLKSILSGEGRDFLVRNNGDQVKVSNLEGKVVGLYFSASWCGPCRRFTPKLVEAYTELSLKNADFEVVFVSADEDEESFNKYFFDMPWLAIPFSDSTTRQQLDELFTVQGVPHLVVLDKNGEIVNDEGVEAVEEYGSDAYPFTQERIEKMQSAAKAAKENQTLQSVFISPSRDFLVSNNGNKVPVSELEGKIVGLYFCLNSYGACRKFTPKLVEMYGKVKASGHNFEVVLVSLDDEEESFKLGFDGMPWLAIPFKDKTCERLVRYFELEAIPTFVVIGADGKTLVSNAADLVEDHGVEAFPFSPEKLEELAEKEKAKMEAQTLESLLVSGERDYVIGKDGIRVPVSELVGKNILLYFSALWCPPCRAFLPTLTDVYNKIKAKDPNFELVFISSDQDQKSFDDYYASMPWLAIPFGDDRKESLCKTFKVYGIPSLVAIGPTGKTVTTEARDLIMEHGAEAYPFTEEHLKELGLNEEDDDDDDDDDDDEMKIEKEGYVCDGDVCRKA